MLYSILFCVFVVLALKCSSAKEGTLLDDSEYQKFLQFDKMLSNVVTDISNVSSIDGHSATLNYANVAMMYHQRNQRWKQGGIAESLHYIELALQSQKSENDQAHHDHKLYRSMLLHKAIMHTNLGQRDAALSVFDSLLLKQQSTTSDHSSIFHDSWNGEIIAPMSEQELSSILYHKAELLLTLYDDFSAAVSLFKEAVALYPCNYRSYLQLVHAMKATKNVSRDEWLMVIAEMEQYLLNIRQRGLNNKMKYKYKPPPIEYHTASTYQALSSVLSEYTTSDQIKNLLYDMYYTIRSAIYPTTLVCTFSRTDSTDAASLYGASASTGYSQSDTTLSGIYASLNWALFTAADALPLTGDPEVDIQSRNLAWKYLLQARHFDRQSINEQHLYMDYQQRAENDEQIDVDADMLPEGVEIDNLYHSQNTYGYIPTVSSGNDVSNISSDTSTLGETAVRKMTEHSAAQVKHLVNFFKKGYWGKTEHYENYTTRATSATNRNQYFMRENGSKSRIPIFIVGFFRSGSTLLESLLEAHSDYVRIPDTASPHKPSDSASESRCDADFFNVNTTECTLAAELGYQLHSVWGMGENSPFVFEMYAMQEETLLAFDTLEKQRALLETKYAKKKNSAKREQEENKLDETFMESYQRIVDKRATTIVGKMQKAFVDMHINPIAAANTSITNTNATLGSNQSIMPAHIIDKMLTNYVNIGLIHLVFPKAIILHTIRDPLDTLYSCYSTRFGDPAAVYTLHTETLVQKYVQYLEVMQHFRQVLPYYTLPHWGVQNHNTADIVSGTEPSHTPFNPADITKATNKVHKESKTTKRKRIQALVDVRYEALVANPERVIRYLLNDILGIAYKPARNNDSTMSATVKSDGGTIYSSVKDGITTNGATTFSSNISTITHTSTRVVQTASRLQVKQPVYASSVGRWLKYKAELQQSIIPSWQKFLPYLASINALPFADFNNLPSPTKAKNKDKCKVSNVNDGRKKRECVFMNWNCSDQFDYSEMLQHLQ